ncbi:hypothetical protein QTO34_017079 [Cnephaeus nilssonii]|uniref:Uncharacterized protein n=1 Tax=Cnephaeus nilssonii TaxID=3371016 RepID=A0AA40I0C6_CNENI|nr:hypothetical protein QTO34_017079 [Eptesicus nilssonii]
MEVSPKHLHKIYTQGRLSRHQNPPEVLLHLRIKSGRDGPGGSRGKREGSAGSGPATTLEEQPTNQSQHSRDTMAQNRPIAQPTQKQFAVGTGIRGLFDIIAGTDNLVVMKQDSPPPWRARDTHSRRDDPRGEEVLVPRLPLAEPREDPVLGAEEGDAAASRPGTSFYDRRRPGSGVRRRESSCGESWAPGASPRGLRASASFPPGRLLPGTAGPLTPGGPLRAAPSAAGRGRRHLRPRPLLEPRPSPGPRSQRLGVPTPQRLRGHGGPGFPCPARPWNPRRTPERRRGPPGAEWGYGPRAGGGRGGEGAGPAHRHSQPAAQQPGRHTHTRTPHAPPLRAPGPARGRARGGARGVRGARGGGGAGRAGRGAGTRGARGPVCSAPILGARRGSERPVPQVRTLATGVLLALVLSPGRAGAPRSGRRPARGCADRPEELLEQLYGRLAAGVLGAFQHTLQPGPREQARNASCPGGRPDRRFRPPTPLRSVSPWAYR